MSTRFSHGVAVGLISAILFALIVAAGCSQRPADGNDMHQPVTMNLSLTSTSMQISLSAFRVTVRGEDFGSLSAPLQLVGNTVVGDIMVPAGPNRTFIVEGLDAEGQVIYRGTTTADVAQGTNPQITVALLPAVPMVRLSPRAQRVPGDYHFTLTVEIHNFDSLRGIDMELDWDTATVIEPDSSKLIPPYPGSDASFSGYYDIYNSVYFLSLWLYTNSNTVVGPTGHRQVFEIYFSTYSPGPEPDFVDLNATISRMTLMNGDTVDVSGVLVDDARLEVSLDFPQVEFPDPELEQSVRRAANKREGVIYVFEVDTITVLEAIDRGVESLDGIEALPVVRQLYMGYNGIEDLSPLVTLTKLEGIELAFNNVKDLAPLIQNSGLGNGDYVDLVGCPLDSFAVNVQVPILRERGVNVILGR